MFDVYLIAGFAVVAVALLVWGIHSAGLAKLEANLKEHLNDIEAKAKAERDAVRAALMAKVQALKKK